MNNPSESAPDRTMAARPASLSPEALGDLEMPAIMEFPARIGPLENYAPYLRLMAGLHISASLKSKIDASDVAQQTLLQAHRQRAQFKGKTEGEWLGWLRAILASTINGHLRHYHTRGRDMARERSIEEALDQSSARLGAMLASQGSSPSECASRDEEAVLLAQAIASLLPDEQQAIGLHHLECLAVSEVAERMGRTRAAVAGLLFRGLKRLRGLMRPMDTCNSAQEGDVNPDPLGFRGGT